MTESYPKSNLKSFHIQTKDKVHPSITGKPDHMHFLIWSGFQALGYLLQKEQNWKNKYLASHFEFEFSTS